MASGSSFRPIRPNRQHSPPDLQDEDSRGEQTSSLGTSDITIPERKKRKAPHHVSANACTSCKKARAKCDGIEPNPCSRCVNRNLGDACHYEVHVKTVKEEMIKKIKTQEETIRALHRSIKERDDNSAWLFKALKSENREQLLDRIQGCSTEQEVLELIGRPAMSIVPRQSPESGEGKWSEMVKKYEQTMQLDCAPDDGKVSRWTTVTGDDAVVHHLMALYFTWVHPVHMLFSEKHVMGSFRNGDHVYCTGPLLNAVCAMGCFMLVDQGGDNLEAKQLASRFADEVYSTIEKEETTNPNFPITQAVLFLVELSAGQARRAASHLRLAVECLNGVDEGEYSAEALEISNWGIHTLSTLWSTFCYQKPWSVIATASSVVFQDVEMDQESAKWQPYRFPTDKASQNTPHSFAIRTSKELAKLSLLQYDSLSMYCGERSIIKADHVLSLYRRYLRWFRAIPADLTIEDATPQSLPHIYFLHIMYFTSICMLFQPLLDLDPFPKTTKDHLGNITHRAARNGVDLIRVHHAQYGGRYMCPFQAFCLVHLARILLRGRRDHRDGSDALHFCLEVLTHAHQGYAFIGPLQYMFCKAAGALGMSPPQQQQSPGDAPTTTSTGHEALFDTCDRLTFVQPVNILDDRLDPDFPNEFDAEWRVFIETHADEGIENGLSAASRSKSGSAERHNSSGGSPNSVQMHINSVIN